MRNIFLFLITFSLFSHNELYAGEKKFKRALVLGGMGIAPGVGLGVIAGLKKAGWVPDVIITTCGFSMSAAIYSSFPDDQQSLAYTKSSEFKSIQDQAQFKTKSLLKIQKNFTKAKDLSLIPPIFENTILNIPEEVGKFFPEKFLGDSPNAPRIIILAAKAHFGPEMVGRPKGQGKNFTQVFFTDTQTAEFLKDYQSPIAKLFPNGQVEQKTEIITNSSPEEAVRASITDPFLLNPAKIGNEYYFTGAVDLLPIELAQDLAEEVISNYPIALFSDYEDLAIESTFGFKQTDSVRHSLENTEVKWIDLFGAEELKFDPRPQGLIFIKSGIPSRLKDFQEGIQKQWDLGFERGIEAINLQKNGPSKKHLRNPLVKSKG